MKLKIQPYCLFFTSPLTKNSVPRRSVKVVRIPNDKNDENGEPNTLHALDSTRKQRREEGDTVPP